MALRTRCVIADGNVYTDWSRYSQSDKRSWFIKSLTFDLIDLHRHVMCATPIKLPFINKGTVGLPGFYIYSIIFIILIVMRNVTRIYDCMHDSVMAKIGL